MIGLSVTSTIQRDTDLLFSAVDQELVIFQINKCAYFSLDEVGADIWRRLETPVTVSALCSALADDYDAAPSDIERDVLALLNDMIGAELIILQQP